ncbi:MAG: glycoside hydrolase family 9 protein [Clostridia bacterium]|nr:glycoside hydrolase family 9 protein [Clostridia bacterium]
MNIQINQLGYTPGMHKTAVLRGQLDPQMLVKNAAGDTVLTVDLSPATADIWGDTVREADFSALRTPGVYTLHCGQECSQPVIISDHPYADCLTALTDMLYLQRCGGEVKSGAGCFAHPACHTGLGRVHGTQEKREVSGGWHDAGDYGRYIVPAAKTVADMLLAVQWNGAALTPTLTDTMDEIRWELEWMLKMQREDGGVFHKVTCATFCAMEWMPHEEKEELIICPVSTTATGDFAACMAMASRFYAHIDADFAARMLDAAVRAWDFLAANGPMLFHNPEEIKTGEYGDGCDADERLWAHVELALATGEDKYLHAAQQALQAIDRGAAPLGWGDVRGYAAIEGLKLPGGMGDLCREWVIDEADRLLKRINAYGITMTDSLPWGSNMNIANDGVMLCQAWKLTGDEQYLTAALKQLHYLLGVNPMGVCYVTGFGAKTVRYPHHRPSVAQGTAQPGMLSGGPASGMMDPCAAEHLQGQPAGKSFIDMHGSYSTNEICIYWNSPLIALLAGLI